MTKKARETAVVPAGMGGLGDLTEAALVEAAQKDGATKGSATPGDIRDAMGNVQPQLEQVRVKGHGANLFQFADEKQVDGQEGLLGVVVAYTRHNSWFSSPYGESPPGELPACFSNDGDVVAGNAAEPQCASCTSCPRNRDARNRTARDEAFEKAKEDKGHVCSNYLSLAVALPERDLPISLRLTRQSFRPWADYAQALGTVHGRYLPYEVVTRIRLRNRTGSYGDYSVAEFSYEGALPEELRSQFAKQKENYRALLQRAAEKEDREGSSPEEAQAAADQAATQGSEAPL